MSIGILITSRNNYLFMEKFWAPKIQAINKGKYPILNIDEDSNDDEKEYGKKVCAEYKIDYLDREERGMHNNIHSAIKHFGDSVKYIVWFQTDCWPLHLDFFDKLNDLVSNGKLDEFGVVGFNGIAENIVERKRYDKMIEEIEDGGLPIGVVARSPLEPGDQWYCGVTSRRIKKAIPEHDGFKKPFAVSIVAWFAAAINVKKFKKYINKNHPFQWFRCWDDICCQFLKNNIYNITIPNLFVDHRPDLKPEGNVPLRAVRLAYKGDDKYHSLVGFTEKEWKKVWGFEYDNRDTFRKVYNRHKGTFLADFYHHDPQRGPLETFDL